MARKTIVDLVLWLEDLFGRHGVTRSYGGAIARNFYALPRLTKDVDVLVLVSQPRIPAIVQELMDAGASALVTDEAIGVGLPQPLELGRVLDDLRGGTHMTRLLCFGSRVELFSAWLPFDHEVFRRAREQHLGGRRIRVHAPEDLIVYKKIFNRAKDIEDIKAILLAQAGRLDLALMRASASQLLDEGGANELEDLVRRFYGTGPTSGG